MPYIYMPYVTVLWYPLFQSTAALLGKSIHSVAQPVITLPVSYISIYLTGNLDQDLIGGILSNYNI